MKKGKERRKKTYLQLTFLGTVDLQKEERVTEAEYREWKTTHKEQGIHRASRNQGWPESIFGESGVVFGDIYYRGKNGGEKSPLGINKTGKKTSERSPREIRTTRLVPTRRSHVTEVLEPEGEERSLLIHHNQFLRSQPNPPEGHATSCHKE